MRRNKTRAEEKEENWFHDAHGRKGRRARGSIIQDKVVGAGLSRNGERRHKRKREPVAHRRNCEVCTRDESQQVAGMAA
jgi:hypothetical protein